MEQIWTTALRIWGGVEMASRWARAGALVTLRYWQMFRKIRQRRGTHFHTPFSNSGMIGFTHVGRSHRGESKQPWGVGLVGQMLMQPWRIWGIAGMWPRDVVETASMRHPDGLESASRWPRAGALINFDTICFV